MPRSCFIQYFVSFCCEKQLAGSTVIASYPSKNFNGQFAYAGDYLLSSAPNFGAVRFYWGPHNAQSEGDPHFVYVGCVSRFWPRILGAYLVV
jgi:hypothetical protein